MDGEAKTAISEKNLNTDIDMASIGICKYSKLTKIGIRKNRSMRACTVLT